MTIETVTCDAIGCSNNFTYKMNEALPDNLADDWMRIGYGAFHGTYILCPEHAHAIVDCSMKIEFKMMVGIHA